MKYRFCFLLLASFLTLYYVSVAFSQQDAALVGYWPFEEGKGTAVKDQSAKGNDGVIKGDVNWVNGNIGKALEFKSGSYVEIPDSDSLKDMKAYTVALWVKMNKLSADWNHILEKDSSYAITINSGGGDFRFTPNSGKVWAESKYKVNLNTWYYVTLVADSSAIQFYVNAKKEADLKEALAFTTNTVTIGHGPLYPVDGTVDEVKIWAVALKDTEIAVAMKGNAAVDPSAKMATTWASIKN
jgi:hypothetical protein